MSSHYLAKYVRKSFQCLISEQYNIKNSIALKENIKKITLERDKILVSYDVVSFSSNFPIKLVLDKIEKRWDTLKKNTVLEKKQQVL